MMGVIIDIKSGKATPATALQLAGYALLNNFDVKFEEDGHLYTHNKTIIPSVTTILKEEGFVDDTWFTEWAREKGSNVHLAIKYDVAGELDEETLDDEIRPYLKAFRKFMKESGFKVERAEVPGISTTYGYAGTPDLVGYFPHVTQARRFALEINNKGKYKLIPYQDQNDFAVWLSAVAVHRWKINNLKGR
jgi:hypothetical protein